MISHRRSLHHYFLACYVIMLAVCFRYLDTVQFTDTRTTLFAVAAYLTYAFMYLLPALVLTLVARAAVAYATHTPDLQGTSARCINALALALTGFTGVLVYIDVKTFEIFGYHLNGFVMNLILTPGGVESMGMTTSSTVTLACMVAGFVATLATAMRLIPVVVYYLSPGLKPVRLYRYLLAAFFGLSLGERFTYGVSHIQAHTSVLVAAAAFPFYVPLTFRDVAKRFGFTPVRHEEMHLGRPVSRLTYPLHPLELDPPARPLNVVWLISESLRADMLDPEIMPELWRFSEGGHRFTNHYSGSNSTRMGVFSMFYGLYGPYWFACLDAERNPVLMDVLHAQNYQMQLFTSARFSYPEFDKTVFAGIPSDLMHSPSNGPSWRRDRENIGDMLAFIKGRDPTRPFFTFMFFESPHASYLFPPESVLRTPYLEELNFATMSVERDMPLIKNRYINAVHHLDSQIGRVVSYLREADLLQNTIVVVAGDHGEEFMEKGHWGHGSFFTEEQVRTPMVLWIPGTGHSVKSYMTSHLDVPATVLPHLGVRNPAEDYSLGYDMLGDVRRQYTVVSHWHTVGYIDDRYKATFTFHMAASVAAPLMNPVTDANDGPVRNDTRFYTERRDNLIDVMHALARFGRRS